MATGQRVDPYGNFDFLVEIDGITRAAFHDVTGFDSSIDVIEHREGGENTTPRKIPGMTKYSNITLKWGMRDDTELYDWHRRGDGRPAAGARTARSCSRTQGRKIRWNFYNAWPGKWTGPTSTPRATTWRSRRSSWPTKASRARSVSSGLPEWNSG